MGAVGIISEYNPLHNGHLYHLRESRKRTGAEAVVVVMSGNFTQRGQPAVADKWDRAKAAVLVGADLVLELPFAYACNSAEHFAGGAVELLNSLGCVDALSFGSESGDIEELKETVAALSDETDAFKAALKESLARGNAHPKARADAVERVAGKKRAAILRQPNNILAVEYIRQLARTGSGIEPVTIPRKGAGYHETELAGAFSSAAAIRKALAAGTDETGVRSAAPKESLDALANLTIDVNKIFNNYFRLLAAKITMAGEEELASVLFAGEGLGNRMKKAVRRAGCAEDLIDAIKSKRYTRTRIERLLTHTLIGLTDADFAEIRRHRMNYARVLAFNATGAALLKKIRQTDRAIPVVTNINKQADEVSRVARLARYDLLASDLYNLLTERQLYAYSDHVRTPYYAAENKNERDGRKSR